MKRYKTPQSGPGRPNRPLRSEARWSALERFIRVQLLYPFFGEAILRDPTWRAPMPKPIYIDNEDSDD